MKYEFIDQSILSTFCPPKIVSQLITLPEDRYSYIAIEEKKLPPHGAILHLDHHRRSLRSPDNFSYLLESPLLNTFILTLYLIQQGYFDSVTPTFFRNYPWEELDLDQRYTLLTLLAFAKNKPRIIQTLINRMGSLFAQEFMIYGQGINLEAISPDPKYNYKPRIINPQSGLSPVLEVSIDKGHLNDPIWHHNLLYIAREAIEEAGLTRPGVNPLETGLVTVVSHGKPNSSGLQPSKTNYVLGFLADNDLPWYKQPDHCDRALNTFARVVELFSRFFVMEPQSRNLFIRAKKPQAGFEKIAAYDEFLNLLTKL